MAPEDLIEEAAVAAAVVFKSTNLSVEELEKIAYVVAAALENYFEL